MPTNRSRSRRCRFLPAARGGPAFESLTERNRGLLILLVKGFTNGRIAEALGISIEIAWKRIPKALGKNETKARARLAKCAFGCKGHNPIGL